MDILKLIKDRRTIRRYKNKPIPKKILDKIIEAGIWGPSLHGFQPWKLVIIRDKNKITRISSLLIKKTEKMYSGYKQIMLSTARTINNSMILIAVYNTGLVRNKMKEFGKEYENCAKISEIEAISASIQNIMLFAQSKGIGICWTVFPIFCEKSINKLLKQENKLLAILTLGYPDEKGKSVSLRAPKSQTLKYF